MRIAIESVVGIILGLALFSIAIFTSTDNYLQFLSLPSFLLVVGGTLAATMLSFRGKYVVQALKELIHIFSPQNISDATLYNEVKSILSWARVIKSKGILGLEEELGANGYSKDPFLKYSGELLITGYKGDELRKMLTNFAESTYDRNMTHYRILRTMASFSPGFGMLGTVIGLIIMLDDLGTDAEQIGHGLALALMTTLYGVFLSQLILRPAAEKVRQKQEIQRYRNLLVTEGFVLLGQNKDSMLIQDMLNSFLDPALHFDLLSDKREKAKEKDEGA